MAGKPAIQSLTEQGKMDFRFERIQNQIEGCLLEAGIYERPVEGAHLFETELVEKGGRKWLILASGISENEADAFFSDQHKRERAIVPIQVNPSGQLSVLLIVRPEDQGLSVASGRCITEFSTDVQWIEMYQGCYVRVNGLESPAVQQIRWELDLVAGHQPPQEAWLRPWAKLIGCNPGHPPSHWHINSPPLEIAGPRKRRQTVTPPELRLAVGLPNPLLLLLSLSNWLRNST